MSALITIGWFLLLSVSTLAVFELVGLWRLVCMFPEGKRWWMLPVQFASLAFFAAVVLNHPFG